MGRGGAGYREEECWVGVSVVDSTIAASPSLYGVSPLQLEGVLRADRAQSISLDCNDRRQAVSSGKSRLYSKI